MPQAGWYPDPGGQQGMFRYWDGSAWTWRLTANPAAESFGGPPSGPPRQPPGPNGRPPGSHGQRPGQRNRNPAVLWAIVAAVVVLAVIAAFAWPRLFGGTPPAPAVPPAPTTSAWDESSPTPSATPTPTPTPTPSRTPTPTPTPTPRDVNPPCPPYDTALVRGRLFGGGLSVPEIHDSRWKADAVRAIPWATCATGLERQIATDWVSEVILAGVQPFARTDTLKEQADAIALDSSIRFYRGEMGRLVPKSSKAITVGGLDAWELRFEVRIDYLGSIPGDNVDVVVVQHRDGSRSALLTFATIGDTATQRQVDATRAGVRVENR
ncbi:MAG: DUF2510 domain-containing protein [Micropruina sp.]|uniref:DUF2510 domain-containing protein n=1 Tax=Micropruina sp. TaxID=2737536 RepID=UPI0039E5FB9A